MTPLKGFPESAKYHEHIQFFMYTRSNLTHTRVPDHDGSQDVVGGFPSFAPLTPRRHYEDEATVDRCRGGRAWRAESLGNAQDRDDRSPVRTGRADRHRIHR